jgi:antitoxin component YwqK of YwqJK toxin-antitoxin module
MSKSFSNIITSQEYEGDKLIREFSVDENCLLNGFELKYYENGYIREVAQYYDDMEIGPKYEFNPDGTIISIEYFENGLLEGISRYYHPNGRLSRLCHYSKGNLIRCDEVRYTVG